MRTALALALALAFTGCIADDPVDSAAVADDLPLEEGTDSRIGSEAGRLDKNSSVDVPVWVRGDSWTVRSTGAGTGESGTLVVTRADGDYEMATTSEQTAGYDALFDVSYIGRIRASDLAGSQQGQAVQFFAFPLENGKTWSTMWDGQEIALTARFAPAIETPLGPQPGFVVEGLDSKGRSYVNYDYVPALRWWTHLDFGDYGFKVTGVKANWTGDVVVGTAKPLASFATQPPGKPPAGTFRVEPDQTYVVLTIIGTSGGGPHARGLVVTDPDNQPQGGTPMAAQGTTRVETFETQQFPAKAGEWKYAAPTAHDTVGYYAYTFHQLAFAKVAV